MAIKIKVYELAKELGMEPQHLVDTVQRLGIEIKNTMNILGIEEARMVRDHVKKNKLFSSKSATPPTVESGKKVTEKRVGTTVIRRRSSKAEEKVIEEPKMEEESESVSAVAGELEPSQEMLNEVSETPAIEEPEAITEVVAEETLDSVTTQSVVDAAPVSTEPGPKTSIKKKFFPSIIKKVATEAHLVEKVGPKVDKPKKVEKPTVAATPKAKGVTEATETAVPAGRRVREVEVGVAGAEAAKEVGKRRVLERQSTVFKSADYLKRELVHSTKKKKSGMARAALKTQITVMSEHKKVIEMGESLTPADFAKQMGVKAAQVIGKLMGMGVTATINQPIDFDTATLLAHELGWEVKQNIFKESAFIPETKLDEGKMQTRPPVVTVMGHVDHGKTSLLDAIRLADVAKGEAGGITQHIGAYSVQTPKGKVTFLDTPGHEAFTAMRARGAKVTDIVVLVVSAVDGVMPQTIESLNHAKAANVPIIVAVNKTDLPDANPDKIKQTLAGHDLNPEDWGGQTIYVNVSAKTKKNIDQLLENILLQAEMLELKASYDCPARGAIVEAKLDKNRGPICTVLVQHGKLKLGEIVVSGVHTGKIRAMSNSAGEKISEAFPGDPVEVLGFQDVPQVGDDFFVAENERSAKELAAGRLQKQKDKQFESRPKATLEDFLAATKTGDVKELKVILKTDVVGSCEALKETLVKFPSDKVKIKLLHAGTGGITESDVMLAHASQAVILGFNVRPDLKASRLAEADKVEVRTYTIIYDMLDDLKKIATGLLGSTTKEKVIGRAEIRNVFNIPKVGAIAGSAVIDGKVVRGCFLRLLRDNKVVYEGKISSLKRFKDDVKEVAQGYECGIAIENYNDLKLGDQFEAFLKEEIKDQL